VIGRDGTLTGYRWGVARKKALLEREREAVGGAAGVLTGN
jgi:AraC family transcriptional regulator of adaptative response/methylated-DNA-[protein]-cysteine methyltransferase